MHQLYVHCRLAVVVYAVVWQGSLANNKFMVAGLNDNFSLCYASER